MPADDPSGARPAQPVVLRIKLRYDDVDAMVQRFAPNVGRSGLFLPTKSLQPIGTEVKFELRLANDQPVLVGLGRVKSARAPDPANPRAAFGIAIELMRVTREGREVIIRMIERRRALGLADVAIPMPEDVETAKRADLDSQPRADAGAIVRDGLAGSLESAPILSTPPPKRAASVGEAKRAPTPPIAESRRASEPLMTAPRVTPLAMAAARPIAERSAPVLAPEPARAKRPRVADLIAKAGELSGSAFTTEKVPELDDQVDIGKALARARALAGANDLDEELAALREVAAAPLAEISIEAASAELARQLGGAAVGRRVKGAVRVETAVVTALGTAEITTVPPPEPEPEPEPVRERPGTSSEEMDRLAAEAAAGIAATHGPGAIAVERADEPPPVIEAVPEAVPEPVSEPVVEAVVAPAPAIAEEDNELGSFGRALDAARIHTGVSTQAAPPPAADDDEIAELDADDIEELPGESTQIGQQPAADPSDVASSIQQAAAVYEAELAQVPEPHPSSADDFNEEEISDLDVLAEADADDDDLLAANAERESQDGAPAYAPPQEHYAHEHPAVYGEATPEGFGEQTYAPADPYAAQAADPYAAVDPQVAHVPHDSFAANEPDPYTAEDPIGYADPDAEPVLIGTPAAARATYGRAQSYDSYPPTPYGDPAREAYVPDPYAQEAYGQQGYDPQRAHDPAYAAEDAYANEVYAQQAAKPADEDFDFASHLDLGDESGVQHPPAPDPSGYDIPSEYTFAEKLPTRAPSYADNQVFPETPGLDEALEFDEPHQFATQTPAPPTPRPPSRAGAYSRQRSPSKPQRAIPAQPAHFEAREDSVDFDEPHGFVDRSGRGNYPDDPGGRDGRDNSGYSVPLDASRLEAELTPPPAVEPADDLESALSTLDVDLDHLEVPLQHRSRRPRAERSSDRGSRPLPGMPPERSPSEPPTAPPTARPVRQTAHTTPRPAAKRPSAAPPAVPIAAKRPTAPPPRATSEDDGVIIDFDDDE